MSTRDDARLTAEERAALSNLEALATADDPQLAARLRGPGRWSVGPHRDRLRLLLRSLAVPAWAYSLWFAVPAVVAGLFMVVLSLSVGWPLGVCGAVVAAAGLTSLVRYARHRMGSRPGPAS